MQPGYINGLLTMLMTMIMSGGFLFYIAILHRRLKLQKELLAAYKKRELNDIIKKACDPFAKYNYTEIPRKELDILKKFPMGVDFCSQFKYYKMKYLIKCLGLHQTPKEVSFKDACDLAGIYIANGQDEYQGLGEYFDNLEKE